MRSRRGLPSLRLGKILIRLLRRYFDNGQTRLQIITLAELFQGKKARPSVLSLCAAEAA